jgi:hypothetical protein
MSELALPALQRWFLDVVTHPDGVEAGAGAAPEARAAADLIEPSRALSAAERLGIYADAYFMRLYEVLEEDFPALVALLGGPEARALFRAYLCAHPSDHPNLNQLGRRLAGFLERGGGQVAARAFAAELAHLERAVQEVFDAPRAETLGAADLAGLAPAEYGALRLPLAPHVRLLACAYPTHAWYQAFREGGREAAPPAAPSWLLLYRRDYRVWRLPLTQPQHRLLTLFGEGRALGEALALLAAEVDLAPFAGELGGWFQDWAGLGLFARPA